MTHSFKARLLLASLLFVFTSSRSGAETNQPTHWNGDGFVSLHFITPDDLNHTLIMEGRGELANGKGFALQYAQDALGSPHLVTYGIMLDYFYETSKDQRRFRIDYIAVSGSGRLRVLGQGKQGLVASLNAGLAVVGWDDYEGSPEIEEPAGDAALLIGSSMEAQLGPLVIEGGYSRRQFHSGRFDFDLSSPYVRLGIRQRLR